MHSEQRKAADMSCNVGKILTQNEEKAFTLERSKRGTGSLERWWKLHPWRYAKLTWMRPSATCSNWHQEGRRDLGSWFAAQELELMADQLMVKQPKQGMLGELLTAPGSPSLERRNFRVGTTP